MYEEDKEQSILSRPNDRYKHIEQINNMTQDSQTLEQIMSSMRDVDNDFQRDAAPPAGSAARVEVRTQRSVEDKIADGIAAGLAKAELLWVHKYAREDARPSTSRGPVAYTLCYCCGEKGHYARDCSEAVTAKYTFCSRNGHKDKAWKSKKDRDEADGRSGIEASFFMGDEAQCSMVQFGQLSAYVAKSTLSTT